MANYGDKYARVFALIISGGIKKKMNKKDYKKPDLSLIDLGIYDMLTTSGDNMWDNDGADIGDYTW